MAKKTINCKAFAKVNLALDVIGARDDGYHNIHSIACLIDLYDCVKVSVSQMTQCSYNLTFSDKIASIYGDELTLINFKKTALRLAEQIQSTYQTPAVDIDIEIDIPFGIGVGGSSTDAAAVAYLMGKLFNIDNIDEKLLLSAGADVPFFYHSYRSGGAKRVQKVGSVKESLPFRQLYIALAWVKSSAQTQDIFASFDMGVTRATINVDSVASYFYSVASFDKLKLGNALESSAMLHTPDMLYAKQCLKGAGFDKIVMTGSGTGYIGVEESAASFCEKYNALKDIAGNGINIGAYKTIEINRGENG